MFIFFIKSFQFFSFLKWTQIFQISQRQKCWQLQEAGFGTACIFDFKKRKTKTIRSILSHVYAYVFYPFAPCFWLWLTVSHSKWNISRKKLRWQEVVGSKYVLRTSACYFACNG